LSCSSKVKPLNVPFSFTNGVLLKVAVFKTNTPFGANESFLFGSKV